MELDEVIPIIKTLTLVGGIDKKGQKENISFSIHQSEVISIVGPTGSGKSQLLKDIESLSNGDTPSRRVILINEEVLTRQQRRKLKKKLVAQLSQNMNFIIDTSVEKFLEVHARSRNVAENAIPSLVMDIISTGNTLCGESFNAETPITLLSGGQSRAVMIADIALLSQAPIVLIDEIENAGIDRKKALSLLLAKGKIVLISTHDPILALNADKRIIMRNGCMSSIMETNDEEKDILSALEEVDRKMMALREKIRSGERITISLTTQ